MTENLDLVNEYGQPLKHDRNFDGPRRHNRSCTDVPCLLMFLAFLGGLGFVAHIAFTKGDLNNVLVPTDSFNQQCGRDSAVLNKPYLFIFDLDKCLDPLASLTGCTQTPQICVERCPSNSFVWDEMKHTLSLSELKQRLICLTEEDNANIHSLADAERAINENRCARVYIKSVPFLKRCIFEFSPEVCKLIPPFILQRSTRDVSRWSLANRNYTSEPHLQALALAMSSTLAEGRTANTKNSRLTLAYESTPQLCQRQTKNEEVFKEKIMTANSRLAKLVGNLVDHLVAPFYNSTSATQLMGEEIAEDLVNSWQIVLAALAVTLLAALIFIALMRWIAAPMLWFSVFGVLIGLLVAIYYSIKRYIFWRDTATVPYHGISIDTTIKNLLQDHKNWLYLSIFLCVCFLVIFLLVIVLRKRIRIAIALIKEGSKAVSSIISTMFFPIFSWILFIAVIVFALAVGLCLYSVGPLSFRMIRHLNAAGEVTNENCVCQGLAVNYKVGDACDPKLFQQNCYIPASILQPQRVCTKTTCSFVEIENPTYIKWAFVYNIFGFFWLSCFVSAFSDMVLAATFARWYWTYKKRDVPFLTLTYAFVQTAFYHLGTLAFGSLILAICRMIRLLLEYVNNKLKKYDNAVTRAILCCLRCFFWLLENFLRFLNRNAYIMCAIHGSNFCSSAKDAFNLLMRNCLRVVTLDKVTDFLFFLSKLLITAGAGVGTYYFLEHNPHIIRVHYPLVPTTIVVIAAFLITHVFFGVYSMAVDTLFLCFLEDCERNDGTPEKPYFMSKQLMKILGKKNKFPQRQRRNK